MYNFVTRDYLNKINDFLEGRTSSLPGTQEDLSVPGRVISLLEESNYSQNDISRFIVSYSMNLLSDGGRGGKFNDEYNRFRDFNSEVLYVYKHNASLDWLFHIGSFTGQNDDLETQWFGEYARSAGASINSYVSEAIRLRMDGNVLLKCSTTSVVNEAYMFANYTFSTGNYCSPSDWQQRRIAFNKERVNNLFDNTYANSKYIPIRGFVRYDKNGKERSIDWLNSLSLIGASYVSIRKAIEFASVVLSYFVKGACMAVEGEYRHIIINEAKLNSVTLNTTPEAISIGTFSDATLKILINKQYQKDCVTDFRCGVSSQGWNEYYESSI